MLTPYSDPVPGGISTVVSGLQTLLRNHGNQVYTLAGAGNGDIANHSNLGIGVDYVRHSLNRLRRLSVDIVHAHAHWYTLMAAIRYRRLNPAARLVFSFHTSDVSRWGPLFSWLLGKADVLTFVSASQLAQLRNVLRLGGDLRILYPGVELRSLESATKEEWLARYELSASFPIIVFVGPLDYPLKVRGVVDLIGVTKQLRGTYPTVKLLVVGDGKLKHRVLEAARGSEGSVIVTGFVPDPSAAFAIADVYCHMSYRESFGIAVLEAMAMGSCVVVLSNAGVSELLDPSSGTVVSPDPNSVAEAVRRLAADPGARRTLGTRARETVARHHTWEARWPILMSIYGSV
jgi:glycosyltransferase involved in cell wall biosynthesis